MYSNKTWSYVEKYDDFTWKSGFLLFPERWEGLQTSGPCPYAGMMSGSAGRCGPLEEAALVPTTPSCSPTRRLHGQLLHKRKGTPQCTAVILKRRFEKVMDWEGLVVILMYITCLLPMQFTVPTSLYIYIYHFTLKN